MKSPRINLVPMNAAQFAHYVEASIAPFAQDKIRSGQWPATDALRLARESMEESLPLGLTTPDNYLYVMQDALTKETVGMLWIAAQTRGDAKVAYIYDIEVNAEHRRKGYATAAFAALESRVQALGLSGIALHVFGHNAEAQALYVKLGFQTTNINMFKALASA
ncbi:MAG: GNAT family N-acetyltransferase [Usitatibacteraceae bacterium]